MDKELDTSWFDLKNYEALKTMSIEDWALVIQIRITINDEYEYLSKEEITDHLKYKCLSLVDSFFYSTVNDCAKTLLSNHSFSTPTVNSLTVIESWDIAEDVTFGRHIQQGSIYQKYRDKHLIQTLMTENMLYKMGESEIAGNKAKAEPTAESVWEYQKAVDEQKKAVDEYKKEFDEYKKEFDGDKSYGDFIKGDRTPHDFRHKQYFNRDYISPQAHVTIDLGSNDEQIKNDFSHWLAHFRKESGYRVPKKKLHEKKFTQKTFDYWIEYGLIPYLDLTLVAKIEGKEIKQEKLGELIFPDEPVENPGYRIGHTTKPEAERLMSESIKWSILEQAAAEARKKQAV